MALTMVETVLTLARDLGVDPKSDDFLARTIRESGLDHDAVMDAAVRAYGYIAGGDKVSFFPRFFYFKMVDEVRKANRNPTTPLSDVDQNNLPCEEAIEYVTPEPTIPDWDELRRTLLGNFRKGSARYELASLWLDLMRIRGGERVAYMEVVEAYCKLNSLPYDHRGSNHKGAKESPAARKCWSLRMLLGQCLMKIRDSKSTEWRKYHE